LALHVLARWLLGGSNRLSAAMECRVGSWGSDMLHSWPCSPTAGAEEGLSLASTRASSSESIINIASENKAPSQLQPQPLLQVAEQPRRQQRQQNSASRGVASELATLLRSLAGASPAKRRTAAAALAVGLAALAAWAWARHVRRAARSPAKWGRGRLAVLASAALAAGARRLLGVTARSEVADRAPHLEALEGRQVLACWHPHGLYVVAPLLFHSSAGPRHQGSGIYGFFTAVASACFHLPVFRELLMLFNCRAADRDVIEELLGAGRSVFVCPGGIHEQLETDPGQERVFFPPNLGFVRQAIKHGVPLVPTYNFGENQLYDIPAWSRGVSQWLRRTFGVGLPLGFGRFGLPFLPHRKQLSIRVGRAVEVGAADAHPTDERVHETFHSYCVELRQLFDEHKATDLPPEVAARGLQLIWRGHEGEEWEQEHSWAEGLPEAVQQQHQQQQQQKQHVQQLQQLQQLRQPRWDASLAASSAAAAAPLVRSRL